MGPSPLPQLLPAWAWFAVSATLATAPSCGQNEPVRERIEAAMQRVDSNRLQATIEALVGCGTRHTGSNPGDAERGIGAARDWIEEQMREISRARGGRLLVERQTFTVPSRRMRKDAHLVNLVATLPGTEDSGRAYLLSGHYDSINSDVRDFDGTAPGANDDGSGTAAMLEACRALAGERLPATVIFVAYDGEEMGLLGSTAHAKALAVDDDGPVLDGMITNDIVGNTLGMDDVRRRGYIRAFSYSPRGNDSLGRSLARVATRSARDFTPEDFAVKLVFRGDRYGRGGDHRPFFAQGWPAVRFTEPREDYSRQHQKVVPKDGRPYGDLPRFIDRDYLAQVTRLDVAILYELASAPKPPTNARASGARDRYDTLLTFQLPENATACDIVWRDTTAADWEHTRRIPRDELLVRRGALLARLEGVCLDDVVVGVASVSADGARSRVVTPPEPDGFYLGRTREGRDR